RCAPEPPYLPHGPVIPTTSAVPWMKLEVSRVKMTLECAPLGVHIPGSPVPVLSTGTVPNDFHSRPSKVSTSAPCFASTLDGSPPSGGAPQPAAALNATRPASTTPPFLE